MPLPKLPNFPRSFSSFPTLPPPSPTMKSWAVNRRGITFVSTAGLFLLLLATTYLLFSPSPFSPRLEIPIDSEQHNFGSDWEFPLPEPAAESPFVPPLSGHQGTLEWAFDPARDERNFSLSQEQCSSAFPNFYHEIDRAVEYRKVKNLGRITAKDVDIDWRKTGEIMRVMIYDNQLYIIDTRWADHRLDVPRAISTLQSIHRAIIGYPGKLPNIEFAINMSDWPMDASHKWPLWVLTRHLDDPEKWVMPDFGYWTFPGPFMGEYSKLRSEISENEPEWEKKISKAVWRGATATNKLRDALVEKTKDKSWADVKSIDWGEQDSLDKNGLTIPEHCNYQYVLHTEGHSYSGRGKYLLNCQSVSIVHKPEWIEPHTHLFIANGPNQNMVEVDRDFNKLEASMKELVKNPARAKQIAENSVRTFRDRYLTPAAQACYWRQLIRAWSSISFEPELFHRVKNRDGRYRKEVRGKSFETWISEMVLSE